MKKILLVLSVLFLFSVASICSADSNRPPLTVSITEVSTTTIELNLNYSIINNRSTFIDNLEYRLEIYRGDKLATEGDLFSPLTYVTNTTGIVSKIAPNEVMTGKVSYILPPSLVSGNYFVRFVVSDREYKNIGLDYTKSPILLTGAGSFLGQIEAKFRTSKGDNFLMAGQLIDKTEMPAIVIFLDENPGLKQAMSAGKKFTAEIQVFSLESDQPVHKYESKPILSSTDKDGKKMIKLDLVPWSGIKPFPYQVELIIKDGQGSVVANKIVARWWVDGFMARIGDIQTQNNFYKKNQKLDLNVNLISFQWQENQQAIVDVNFEKPDGRLINFSKEVNLAESYNLDFSDLKMPEKTMIQAVIVTFKDKASGEVYETKRVEMTQDKVYSQSNKLDDILTWSGIILGMIALILLAIYVKNKRKINLVLGVIFLILSIVVLVLVSLFGVSKVFADKEQTISTVWFTVQPSGNQGTCPATTAIEMMGTASCPTCRNGVEYAGEIRMAGQSLGSVYVNDLGHIWESTTFGPYRVMAPLTTNHDWYEASMVTSEGYHCTASSAVATGPAIWCTVPVPLTGTCSASPANPSVGQEVTWTAIGSGGTGLHTYSFTGTGGLSHSGTNVAKKTYTQPGWKEVYVTIGEIGGSQTTNIQCDVQVGSTNTANCGSLLNQTSPTLPVNNGTNLCSAGNVVVNSPFSDGNGKWWWSCGLTSTAAEKMWCPAYGAPINSTCGTASGTPMLSLPTVNTAGLCSGGPTTVGNISTHYNVTTDRNDDHYQWECTGSQGAETWVCEAPRIYTGGLTASCSANPSSGNAPLSVTWSATASGGTGPYTYLWSNGVSGSGISTTTTYTNSGTYNASVRVSDATSSTTVSCSPVSVNNGNSGCSACVPATPIIPAANVPVPGAPGNCGGYVWLDWRGVSNVPESLPYYITDLASGTTIQTPYRYAVLSSAYGTSHRYIVRTSLTGPAYATYPQVINSSPACPEPPDPSLACTLALTSPSELTKVPLNTQATFTSIADVGTNNDRPRKWSVTVDNATTTISGQTGATLDRIFTTIGAKKINAQISSSTPGYYGAVCSVDIIVIEEGGDNTEI